MQEKLFLIGIGLIFLGVFLTMVAVFLSGTGKVEGGGIIFIGPIPIGAATNKEILYLLIFVSIVFFVLFLLFQKFVI